MRPSTCSSVNTGVLRGSHSHAVTPAISRMTAPASSNRSSADGAGTSGADTSGGGAGALGFFLVFDELTHLDYFGGMIDA